ncbi:MAG TPA: hypothetical protein PLH30_05410 [Bacteroidales bacterium]|nr:hypothetical protein [Bacteroidales bacterium]
MTRNAILRQQWRTNQQPKTKEILVYKKETDVGKILGWTLLTFIAGLAITGLIKEN